MNQTEREDLLSVLDALYGDGAWEVTKALTEKQKKRQAQVGLASNVVGIAAGTAGLSSALKDDRLKDGGRVGRRLYKLGQGVERAAKTNRVGRGYYRTAAKPKVAAGLAVGAAGLQVANLAGDAVANRVLSRAAQKKDVHKSADLQERKLKLVKRGVYAAGEGAKKAPKLVETVKKSVDLEIRGEVSKMNTDKKQVFGWASVIEVGGEPVIDLQGDVMTIETIEKAAYSYVHGSRKGGRQHERQGEEPLHVSDMIESFVLTPEKKEKMGLPPETPTGWWVGFQVNDDDTWQAYKDGKLKEFSIHGSGTRKALEL